MATKYIQLWESDGAGGFRRVMQAVGSLIAAKYALGWETSGSGYTPAMIPLNDGHPSFLVPFPVANPVLFSANGSYTGTDNPLVNATYLPAGVVPAGKRCMIVSSRAWSLSAFNVILEVKPSGNANYYRLGTPASANVGGNGNSGGLAACGYIFEPGDTIATYHDDAGNFCNHATVILMWDRPTDGSGLKTAVIPDLATGNNTLYTCPTGSQTIFPHIGSGTAAGVLAPFAGLPAVYVMNNSGGARTLNAYVVPSGGAAGNTNKYSNAAPANAARASLALTGLMGAGDFVVVNTDAAGAGAPAFQTAWATLYEHALSA